MPAPEGGYIRGSGGVEVPRRRVLVVIAALCALALAATAAGVAYAEAHGNARIKALRDRGVPVEVTVTGCLSVSSGIGMGVEYWKCRGSYSLEGRTYEEVIGGSRAFLETGTKVQAVAVPGHPAWLSTAAAVSADRTGGADYLLPIVLGVLAAGAAAVSVLLARGRRRPATA